MIWAISSAQGFISIRFTPKGLSVRLLQMWICLRSRSASSIPPVAMTPKAPALEQAAANSPVAMLAMPPWMMGYLVPKISFKSFIEKPSQSMPSGIDSSPEGGAFFCFSVSWTFSWKAH